MTDRWELVELIGQTGQSASKDKHLMARQTAEAILDAVEPLIRADERERLARWKAEATEVMREWERVWEALGSPGQLGASKATATFAAWVDLRAKVEALPERGARTDNGVDTVGRDDVLALFDGADV